MINIIISSGQGKIILTIKKSMQIFPWFMYFLVSKFNVIISLNLKTNPSS